MERPSARYAHRFRPNMVNPDHIVSIFQMSDRVSLILQVVSYGYWSVAYPNLLWQIAQAEDFGCRWAERLVDEALLAILHVGHDRR
jgi:hypothetical protein